MSPSAPTPLQAFQKALIGDGEDPENRRAFFEVFLTLMDLPAKLYLQTMKALFTDDALATGRLDCRGRRVEPEAIEDIALMTVEAEHDDISGRGQTFAAHELCPRLAPWRRARHLEPGIGHLGLFHGRVWRTSILPRLHRFVREAA